MSFKSFFVDWGVYRNNRFYLVLQAFGVKSVVHAKKAKHHAAEKEQKRLHLPKIDRNYGEAPPFVVVVQGPPGVLSLRLMLHFHSRFCLFSHKF